ncbi:MarR family transcriptional regulator [Streptomyces niveiscabiei]|uniref:MarR family winged helix-turn-helix transcriptional regulator n=1 Tax=Streptomyces niveiscabiei TaxID=164115 RepID=UPI0029A43DD2|nr:MarR family transcriptional regulator [Streptomyces niveiscabiei]MDX3387007.1 MarR family transcriptional regulator [Streptomyces niveiscabiei]
MADLKQVYRDLVQFEIELWNAVDSRLRAAHGLPLTSFEVMRLLGQRSECRVQDVAEAFGITVGGTSKVVDRLEASGYCRRRPNPHDRRSSLIELTPEGRQLTDAAEKDFAAELDLRIGSVLSGDELEAFGATLRTLRAARPR